MKMWRCIVVVCMLQIVNVEAFGQSWNDIFNSSVLKEAVTAVVGGEALSPASLEGTWTYVNPAVELEGDNALKNIAGSVATNEIENKLKDYCAKIGIIEGLFNYTFNSDSTFTNALKGKSLTGTYSVNSEANTVELKYALGGRLNITTLTAHVVLAGNEMSLLFNADKLLSFLSKLSSISDNSTLQMVNKIANEYSGMNLGFELKK